jgi:hypothetical protein
MSNISLMPTAPLLLRPSMHSKQMFVKQYRTLEFQSTYSPQMQGTGQMRTREIERREMAEPNRTLFVVNFEPESTRLDDLRRFFDQWGELERVQLKTKFAFIQVCLASQKFVVLSSKRTTTRPLVEARVLEPGCVQIYYIDDHMHCCALTAQILCHLHSDNSSWFTHSCYKGRWRYLLFLQHLWPLDP